MSTDAIDQREQVVSLIHCYPNSQVVAPSLYTEDCVPYVLAGAFAGREALDKFAGELARPTGTLFTPRTTSCKAPHTGRSAWGSTPPGEPPDYAGLDVIIFRDGKTAALYVFLDSLPV